MTPATDCPSNHDLHRTATGRVQAAWQRLSRAERHGIASGAVVAACLLVALVQTCQQSVQRGERLRAEQQLSAAAAVDARAAAV